MITLPLSAGQVTLTTYYPSPFGSYDRLKLVPRDSLELDPHCDDKGDVGIMYFDNGQGEKTAGIYVCQQTALDAFDMVLLSVFVPPEKEEVEEKEEKKSEEPTVSVQKIVCIGPDGKMGVCINNPSADGTCACQRGDFEKKEE